MSRIPVDIKDMNVGEDKKGELGRKKGEEGRGRTLVITEEFNQIKVWFFIPCPWLCYLCLSFTEKAVLSLEPLEMWPYLRSSEKGFWKLCASLCSQSEEGTRRDRGQLSRTKRSRPNIKLICLETVILSQLY